MLRMIAAIIVSLLFAIPTAAQTNTKGQASKPVSTKSPVFRANKEQISLAQRQLRVPETGKMDTPTKVAVMQYQAANGLRASGTLNRATLEKMGVTLTENQRKIPVTASSLPKPPRDTVARGPVFRATKEQVTSAQRLLKQRGVFSGSESGKLDDETRIALRSYQESVGLKVTGTLNIATLQKMGIGLTDKQRESSSGGSQ